jgi:hypothetical protein|tara:strand:- start:1037 stop:1231 length:195 start_codon:yes stop_codon:yes gene_type:complete
MDERNKEALLDEIWKIALEASPDSEIAPEILVKLELLSPMLDNALGLNEKKVKRFILFGLQKAQ